MAFSMSLISFLVVVASLVVIPVQGREISRLENGEEVNTENVADSAGEAMVKRQARPKKVNFWDRLAQMAGNAILTGGKVAVEHGLPLLDKVTNGATTALIEKAKDKAIEVAIEAYAGGMMDKEEGKREMEDNESPVLRTLRSQYGIDDKVEKREADESGSGPEVKEPPAQ